MLQPFKNFLFIIDIALPNYRMNLLPKYDCNLIFQCLFLKIFNKEFQPN